jgi:hypothetical protein
MTTAMLLAGLATFFFLSGAGMAAIICVALYSARHLKIVKDRIFHVSTDCAGLSQRITDLHQDFRQLRNETRAQNRESVENSEDRSVWQEIDRDLNGQTAPTGTAYISSDVWTRLSNDEP